MIVAYIDAYKHEFGVEPICRVLTDNDIQIAPSTYYAAKSRPPSRRSQEDEKLLEAIHRVHVDSRGLYGVRKVWKALQREGIEVGRDRVARLMRTVGLRGVTRRASPVPRSKPVELAVRPEDLVERFWSQGAPDRVWVADFERQEALLNPAVMKGHRHALIAVSVVKLRAAQPGGRQEGREAALTTTGREGTTRRPGSGKRDGKVYGQPATESSTSLSPAPIWSIWAGLQRAPTRVQPVGNSRTG